jgi:antitoxin component of MazEF toxin-antitoxin module
VAREILKVRKVGGTLVVTLTQAVLEQISLTEGDRVLIEALPPKRILISKEEQIMSNARRTELEIEVLEARKAAVDSDLKYKAYQHNHSMPCEEGMADEQIAMLMMYSLEHQRNAVAAEIAQKRLELFELQGS